MASVSDLDSRLLQHISNVVQTPSTPLDSRLFDEAELVLPRTLKGEQRLAIIQALAQLLPILQQDATPAVSLLLKFVHDLTYTDVLNFGNLPFTEGLAVGEHMNSYNKLIIALLSKATEKPADAAHVAGMLDTMLALVKLWLCTGDTGVASQASRLLLDLLKVDLEIKPAPGADLPTGGQGLIWKRMFGDRDVYGTLFEACTLTKHSSLKLSTNQRTLAQARLMEWLPAVGAMDWSVISRSHHPDIEAVYGVTEGILEFATLRMVDYKGDVLMHRCLVDFYSDLLHATKPHPSEASLIQDSPSLRYLIASGVHARTSNLYLQPRGIELDYMESMFVYGPAANYIATYASSYPDHFLASPMPHQVNERLNNAFSISPAKWAHAESPKHDLHIAASLPRKALLPGADGSGSWSASPASRLPSRSTNPDVLNTLATIFHGPPKAEVTFPPSPLADSAGAIAQREASAARALYFHYLAGNPHFWRDIVSHAETVALKDLALAAIHCLRSVISANWSTVPEQVLPTTIATPESAALAILSPPSLEYNLPYLLKPAQSFANLVGGRGDAESAAYKIASAKFDTLNGLHDQVETLVAQHPGEGFEDILATLNKRLTEGPLSREGEVGGRIGTLEL